ncbi:MAG: hypothetical protein EOO01_25280, partial [Chitinophagaceae bacterium]
MKPILICIGLLCFKLGHSQALKDTLFFSNGSIIIGKLELVKLGVVTFDPDDANDITVQLRKLKTISAMRKIFRIETVAKQIYFGNMLSHPEINKIY